MKVKSAETNKTVLAVVAVSNMCPVNLLGRDFMEKLGIGVIPTPMGMEACRVIKTAPDYEDKT